MDESKERFLRLPEVKHRTGLPRSTIYLYISRGLFPKSRRLGNRSVGWRESDIDAWIRNKMERGG